MSPLVPFYSRFVESDAQHACSDGTTPDNSEAVESSTSDENGELGKANETDQSSDAAHAEGDDMRRLPHMMLQHLGGAQALAAQMPGGREAPRFLSSLGRRVAIRITLRWMPPAPTEAQEGQGEGLTAEEQEAYDELLSRPALVRDAARRALEQEEQSEADTKEADRRQEAQGLMRELLGALEGERDEDGLLRYALCLSECCVASADNPTDQAAHLLTNATSLALWDELEAPAESGDQSDAEAAPSAEGCAERVGLPVRTQEVGDEPSAAETQWAKNERRVAAQRRMMQQVAVHTLYPAEEKRRCRRRPRTAHTQANSDASAPTHADEEGKHGEQRPQDGRVDKQQAAEKKPEEEEEQKKTGKEREGVKETQPEVEEETLYEPSRIWRLPDYSQRMLELCGPVIRIDDAEALQTGAARAASLGIAHYETLAHRTGHALRNMQRRLLHGSTCLVPEDGSEASDEYCVIPAETLLAQAMARANSEYIDTWATRSDKGFERFWELRNEIEKRERERQEAGREETDEEFNLQNESLMGLTQRVRDDLVPRWVQMLPPLAQVGPERRLVALCPRRETIATANSMANAYVGSDMVRELERPENLCFSLEWSQRPSQAADEVAVDVVLEFVLYRRRELYETGRLAGAPLHA